MKTKFFMNGFCAKLALAVVALAGGMFTSCTQEDLGTTFQPGAAKITINAQVFDAITGTDVTSQAQITGAGTFDYANQSSVTVTATLNGETASQNVAINPILAGGQATYNVVLFISDAVMIESNSVTSKGEENYYFDKATHVYSHTGTKYHDVVLTNWAKNENDYALRYKVTYPVYSDFKLTSWDVEEVPVDLSMLKKELDNHSILKTIVTKDDCWASAWSYYTAWSNKDEVLTTYTVKTKNSNETIGEFTTVSYIASCQFDDTALPGHESHYQHAHGQSEHDGGANAGGGIVIAD